MLTYKTILNSLWINATARIQKKVQKHHIQNDYFENEGKD